MCPVRSAGVAEARPRLGAQPTEQREGTGLVGRRRRRRYDDGASGYGRREQNRLMEADSRPGGSLERSDPQPVVFRAASRRGGAHGRAPSGRTGHERAGRCARSCPPERSPMVGTRVVPLRWPHEAMGPHLVRHHSVRGWPGWWFGATGRVVTWLYGPFESREGAARRKFETLHAWQRRASDLEGWATSRTDREWLLTLPLSVDAAGGFKMTAGPLPPWEGWR